MALAITQGLPALTADKAWTQVKASGLQISLIR
jgi:PIN domain nuclease of toxin-antitoxin system